MKDIERDYIESMINLLIIYTIVRYINFTFNLITKTINPPKPRHIKIYEYLMGSGIKNDIPKIRRL